MNFKKLFEFLYEGKKPDKKDILDTEIPKAQEPDRPKVCAKCGSSNRPCECYTDDYYNAKAPQQTPKPSTVKKPKKDD